MKRKEYAPPTRPFERLSNLIDPILMSKISKTNNAFNSLTMKTKQTTVILTVIIMMTVCTSIIIWSINSQSTELEIDKITLPNEINMNNHDTQNLTPVGKMKGEINGEFESFYIAVDTEGQLFINHNPDYYEDRFKKANGWKPISRKQLEAYEQELRFIPNQKRGLKR